MSIAFNNFNIFDGTGASPNRGSILIDNGFISDISYSSKVFEGTEKTINGEGLSLCPGLIDFHSHADFVMSSDNATEYISPFLHQGITTFFGGNCGFSPFPITNESREIVFENSRFLQSDDFSFRWNSMEEYLSEIKNNLLLNCGFLVGHGTLRAIVMGNDPSPMNNNQRQMMSLIIRQMKEQGCFGVSLGLSYVPGIFADEDELESLFAAVADNDMIVTIHGHTYSYASPFFNADPSKYPHNVLDARLFLSLAEKTGARLHLSHVLLKGEYTWNSCDLLLSEIEKAAKRGVDVTFGVIPYHWGNTLINTLLPKWFLEDFEGNVKDKEKVSTLASEIDKLESQIGRYATDLFLLWGNSPYLDKYTGLSFDEIGRYEKLDYVGTILMIMQESKGKARVLTASYSGNEGKYEKPLEALIAHPKSIIEIDAIVSSLGSAQTPAAYGGFPKLIGRYSRDRGIMKIEEAIRKITSFPASRMGASDIGEIKKGKRADLLVFNVNEIIDTNTIKNSCSTPKGIKEVWINGQKAFSDKTNNSDKYGRILRK